MTTKPMDLESVARLLRDVVTPEDLFGKRASPHEARNTYYVLMRSVHEDLHPNEAEQARILSITINTLWEQAERKFANNQYGLDESVTLESETASYVLKSIWRTGDISNLYLLDDGNIAKVCRDPRDNDLIDNEAAHLRTIEKVISEDTSRSVFVPVFPKLVDSFVADDSGVRKHVNILHIPDGMFSLKEVVEAKGPLDPRDYAWMYRRLLLALGFVHHEIGLVHGAIDTEHVLIHPSHGLTVIDWSYAVPLNSSLRAIPQRNQPAYPQFALEGKPVRESLDIYMSAVLSGAMLGGSNSGAFPSTVPVRIQRFFRSWDQAGVNQIQDAWQLRDEFTEIIDSLWPRKYRPFEMPQKEGS